MKTKNLLLTTIIACMAVMMNFTALNAKTIYYVKVNGTGDGTSWAKAAGNIQDMIDKAVAGDEVWVAAGTFYPTRTGLSNSKSFIMKDGVNLYGGFAGNETSIESRIKSDMDKNGKTEAWEFTNETILSGKLSATEKANIVVEMGYDYNNAIDIETLFDGFTVMNGIVGINAYCFSRTATVNNCIIRDNVNADGSSSVLQSGIRNYMGTVSNSKITNNKAYYITPYSIIAYSYYVKGGGIYNDNGTVINCTITNNICEINDPWGHKRAEADGGGIYNWGREVVNCIVSGNSCISNSYSRSVEHSYGGGIYNDGGSVINCCVTNNSLSGNDKRGSGVYNYAYFSPANAYGSTIIKNSTENINTDGGHYYNCITEDSNLEQNFVNPKANDYHLKAGSQYINAGSLANLSNWVLNYPDLDGKPRTTNGKISVGAYEYDPSYTGIIELQHSDIMVYPNPASETITVSGLQNNETIWLYNISGQLILTRQVKSETETIAVGHLPAGIYFVKTEMGKTLKWVKK